MKIVETFCVIIWILKAGFACIPPPGMTTTPGPSTTTEECQTLTQACGSVQCCTGLTCAPLLNVCIPSILPTLPPCKKLLEPCGLLVGSCCDNSNCAPVLNICIPSLGKKKRSAESGCGVVANVEEAAFVECETDGEVGLTWTEVENCEDKFGDFGIPLPTIDDFNFFDLNGDGTLLLEEWQQKADC
eukprot:GFUD01020096.1.p1 GENE.GFUD01020096.1~~GFUD01020096.1.p1  ORF type:complete len:187 (-),score=36.37 GFUD01020096.1:150-710(-)